MHMQVDLILLSFSCAWSWAKISLVVPLSLTVNLQNVCGYIWSLSIPIDILKRLITLQTLMTKLKITDNTFLGKLLL